MLSNAYFLAKFRFDTAENEPAKNLQNFRKMHFRKMHFRKMHLHGGTRRGGGRIWIEATATGVASVAESGPATLEWGRGRPPEAGPIYACHVETNLLISAHPGHGARAKP